MKKSFNLDSEINKLVLTEGIEKPSKDFVKNIMDELNPQKKIHSESIDFWEINNRHIE